tara:strand:- start:167 stop:919 length:753 start_codon:yes stop_codon:yes gene_type:complete
VGGIGAGIMKAPRGIILYEGPSKLDGSPIVVIATLKSSNRKTGDMVQTYIIRSDMDPVSAIKAMLDGAVCGTCVSRQNLGGKCYVNVGQSVLAIYRAFKRGIYPTADEGNLEHLRGRAIRFGSYGDPSAAPVSVWATLASLGSSHTGYTHQITHRAFDPAILDYCMVSVDTPRSALKAHNAKMRTFRVKTEDGPLLPNEIECKADTEGLTCLECGICSGGQGVNVAITVHGRGAKKYEAKYARANLIAVG